MNHIILILVGLILVVMLLTARAAPDEATLNRALRIGYVLNGESMVRELALGSIDVSGLLFVVDSSLIETPKQKD
jgi:hypothetical protein